MQTAIFLCLVVVGCLAMPSEKPIQKRKIHEKMILRAVADMSHAASKRRRDLSDFDAIEMAFGWIDSDSNGHITANEFAGYYTTFMRSIPLNTDQWKAAFKLSLPKVDSNRNGEMEIKEFQKMAEIGGFGGR